jgi:hypothetical protein
MDEQTSLEAPENEVILGESTSKDVRRIRVYDGDGDFIIEVPAGAKVTFGYFNPAAGGDRVPNDYGGRGGNVMKQTALRIYEKAEKGNQLACFLGIRGFRDLQIKKTKLVQKVIVERRYSDDGEGQEDWSGQQKRELVVSTEDDIPF